MPTKEEFLVKFASQTGAEIPGIQSQQKGSSESNINTQAPAPTESTTLNDATTPTESTTQQEDEELFIDSFSDRTKVPLWQDPKFKGIIVALCVLPAVMAVGWIFKDGVPKPNLSTKSPSPPPTAQEPDEDKPKDATDGEWASYAATNGMRQQFSDAASDENTDAQKKIQERANARKKSQGNSATVNPNTRIERTNQQADSVPPYRTASRSYSPPATVRTADTNDYVSPYRTVRGSSTPPIQRPTSYSAPAVRAPNSPALSKPPKVVLRQNSQSLDSSQQQQNSPQERIAAIIAATSTGSSDAATVASTSTEDSSEPTIVTSTGVGNEPAIIASTAIPSRSRPITSRATRSVRSPDPLAHLSSEAAVIDGQPQTLINRSLSARGILLTSIAFTAGDYATIANQPVEIELKEALGDIPVGARIVAVVEAKQNNYSGNGKSEVVRLNPTAIVIGDMEMPLPERAMALSGSGGAPLIAKTGGSSFRRFVGGLAGTVAGGAGLTNFGASQNVEIGDSSYFRSIGANIATSVVSNAAQELQRSGSGDGILVLKAGNSITISVHKPFVLPDL